MKKLFLHTFLVTALLWACKTESDTQESDSDILVVKLSGSSIEAGQSIQFDLEVIETGRYKVEILGSIDTGLVWIEDYINNADDRTYDITGKLDFLSQNGRAGVHGSPLAAGNHQMRLHSVNGNISVTEVRFSPMLQNKATPNSLEQKMTGSSWALKWSDEFDGKGLPDSTKWSYNVGNWGWGNNEPQFYTQKRTKNARQEDGNLIIEAHKNDMGYDWTSARLTTQGKVSFLYGKVEFRAKVPSGRGTWAAGWMLGDGYQDELSWPYCGEIDILECVGFEIEDSSGNGLNHATCHTPAYYFKKGNQISAQIPMEKMDSEFHTYSMEWYPDMIKCLVDGEHYYTYDKTANEKEWPFNQAQNIIINLAVGGGWGGAKGIDPQWENHQYILDYVRVYELN